MSFVKCLVGELRIASMRSQCNVYIGSLSLLEHNISSFTACSTWLTTMAVRDESIHLSASQSLIEACASSHAIAKLS
jgi:hypothetical protein